MTQEVKYCQHSELTCQIVLPEGPHAIVGQELGGDYFKKAGPVIERQVARAGFRMAAWLDKIADGFDDGTKDEPVSLEL